LRESAGHLRLVRENGRPSKRALKREALLAGATILFNRKGIAATSIGEVADALGLTRAGVYYYVDDRADLLFQCYDRACVRVADDLAEASAEAQGLQRVLAFIRLSLAPERTPAAVVTEVGYLDGAPRQLIETAMARNVKTLASFLSEGAEDESIRVCDSEVVAQSILGILCWTRLLPQWEQCAPETAFQRRLSSALCDLLTHGTRASSGYMFRCTRSADALLAKPPKTFNREEAADFRLQHILAVASRLFGRYGIEGATVDAIAAELGATTGALYHYVDGKEDLVIRCYRRGFDLFERIADLATRDGRNGLEQALVGSHVNTQAQIGTLAPLMPQPGVEALPDSFRREFTRRAARLDRIYADMLDQGVADGSCRPCDTKIVAQICGGAFAWLPKWLPFDDDRSPIGIADEITALFHRGLSAGDAPADGFATRRRQT
jgi:AcrR family transcriptional regulator